MDPQQIEGLIPDVSEKPAAGQDGVWETTQLDCAIGDLQRGGIIDSTPSLGVYYFCR